MNLNWLNYLYYQSFKLTPLPSLKLFVKILIQSTKYQIELVKLHKIMSTITITLRTIPHAFIEDLSTAEQIMVQHRKQDPPIRNIPVINLNIPATI